MLSRVQLFVIPWTAVHQASLSINNSWSLLKLMSIESVMPSNHLILCCPLLLLPSSLPSIRVFSSESVLHIRRPKSWSFSFNISPSSEYSGLIVFRIDWFDLLAVQGTLKSSPVATSASYKGLPQWFSGKEFACSAGHPSSISGSERSPGGGHGTHSITLAWKIPQRNLAVYCPRGHEESDTTEQLSIQRTPLEK